MKLINFRFEQTNCDMFSSGKFSGITLFFSFFFCLRFLLTQLGVLLLSQQLTRGFSLCSPLGSFCFDILVVL